MKTIIAGGRDFTDYKYLVDSVFNHTITEVVCGGARGADALGEKYAGKNNLPIIYFPAQWNKYGRGAGHIRNKEMAEYADALIAFWDGRSTGTLNMIRHAKKLNLEVHVYNY